MKPKTDGKRVLISLKLLVFGLVYCKGTQWPSGTVLDFAIVRSRVPLRSWLLCTNANSACHPSGVG